MRYVVTHKKTGSSMNISMSGDIERVRQYVISRANAKGSGLSADIAKHGTKELEIKCVKDFPSGADRTVVAVISQESKEEAKETKKK